MRILILSTTLRRDRAGTAHATVDIANGLAKLSTVDVAVAAYELEEDWLAPEVQIIRYEQAPSRRFFWRFHDMLAIDQVVRSLRGHDLGNFDLCYVRNTAEALGFHRLFPHVPMITHTGAIIAGKELIHESRQRSRFLIRANAAGRHYWERKSYQQANWRHIVSTQLVASQRCEAFGLPADFFEICPLPVDAHAFHPAAVTRNVRAELEIPASALVLLSVCRLTQWKNLDMTFRALARLETDRPVYHVIVGGGRDRERLEGVVRALNLQDSVIFVGQQPDTASYYAAADVFVLLSAIESFGLVYAEAMHMGLPAIGLAHNPPHALTAAQDVIPGNAGYCVGTEDELLQRLGLLLQDDAARQAMGAAGRAHALANYSLPAYLRRLQRIARESFRLEIPLDEERLQATVASHASPTDAGAASEHHAQRSAR